MQNEPQSTAAMSPEALWNRYSATWSNGGSAARAAELDVCLADNVTYCDPNGLIEGRAALSAYIAGYQQQVAPGSHFQHQVAHIPPRSHARALEFSWSRRK